MSAVLAKRFLRVAEQLQKSFVFENTTERNPGTLRAIARAAEMVLEEFELDRPVQRPLRRHPVERKWQKALWNQRNQKLKVKQMLLQAQGEKVQGLLSHHAMAKVMLSNPFLNGRQLDDTLCLDAEYGEHTVSHTYVGRLRDAFAESLISLCKKKRCTIWWSHVHFRCRQ